MQTAVWGPQSHGLAEGRSGLEWDVLASSRRRSSGVPAVGAPPLCRFFARIIVPTVSKSRVLAGGFVLL